MLTGQLACDPSLAAHSALSSQTARNPHNSFIIPRTYGGIFHKVGRGSTANPPEIV